MTKLVKKVSKVEDLRLALVSPDSLVVQASQGGPHLHSRLALVERRRVDLRQLTRKKYSSK
jgi:hypothetical protein